MAAQKQTDAEQIEQLNMLAKAYIGRPTFKPGDLVVRRMSSLPVQHRQKNVSAIAVVVETVDSLRDFMSDKTLFPGQGLLICCTDADGEYRIGWLGAWQYELAPPDLIASFAGHTSH